MRADWTRDAAGQFVDWGQPPYRNPGSGVVRLVLDGETIKDLSSAIQRKRVIEYQHVALHFPDGIKNPRAGRRGGSGN